MEKIDKIKPLLRFRTFIQDGEWKKYKLGDIAQFYKGKGISKNDVTDNGTIPCIRYGELYTHYKEVIDEVTSYTDLSIDDLFMSKANDIIIPSSGETKEDIATASCVLRNNVALGGDINVIRTSNNGVFLSYYLNNAKKHDIAKIAQGISIIHLYNEQLRNLSVEIPNLEEQQKIAECLSSIDSYIFSINEKVEQLKAHKKSLMQKLFPQRGQTVPEYRFPEFEKDGAWVLMKLKEVSDIYQGYGFPEKMQGKTEGKYPFIKVSDISSAVNNGNRFIKSSINYVNENDLSSLKAKPFPKGTVVFAKIGEAIRLNRRVILSQDSLIDNNVAGIKANPNFMNDDFMYYLLLKKDFTKYAGGVVPAIKKATLENLDVLLPPSLYEKNKIAEVLASIDERIYACTEKISYLERHKRGLIQQMFPTSK